LSTNASRKIGEDKTTNYAKKKSGKAHEHGGDVFCESGRVTRGLGGGRYPGEANNAARAGTELMQGKRI